MIKFNDILLKLENIIIFKLTQQLLKLIKEFKKNKNIKKWKRHVRFLQIYYKFNEIKINKNFRVFYDKKDVNFKNFSLEIFKENSKVYKNKNSKKILILIIRLTIVKGLIFKIFNNFKVTFFSKIKRNSRTLKRS